MSNKRKLQSLAHVPVLHKAIILDYLDEDIPVKLLEMGLLPGNEVFVKGQAALKGALHVQVGSYSLALRLDEAVHILVDQVESFDHLTT